MWDVSTSGLARPAPANCSSGADAPAPAAIASGWQGGKRALQTLTAAPPPGIDQAEEPVMMQDTFGVASWPQRRRASCAYVPTGDVGV